MNKFDCKFDDKNPLSVPQFKKNKIITEYADELCEKVINYGRKGYTIEGFAGYENICVNAMSKWLSKPDEYAKFDSAVKISHSACIHFWQETLNFAVETSEWQAVGIIKGILSDIMKSTPKQLRDNFLNNLHVQSAEEKAGMDGKAKLQNLLNAVSGIN